MISLRAPHKVINTCIELPGSKSISNRLLMIREVNGLSIHYKNLSDSEDTVLLARALGEIHSKKKATIDIHHAGTDMRFLTAYLAVKEGEWVITGSERMKERPISELVHALKQIGAEISWLDKEGFPPLQINGKKLTGGKVQINGGISSQFISALLLIASKFENGLTIEILGDVVSRPYLNMTIELLRSFGAKIKVDQNVIIYDRSGLYVPSEELNVESDWSSASYWYSIAALSKNCDIELKHLHKESLQADAVLPEIFERLGVKTQFINDGIKLTKQKIESFDFECDFVDCPDIAQTLAVTCVGLGINARLSGLKTLKHKETDRVAALKNELEKFGAKVEANADSIIVTATTLQTPNSEIQTYSDHRMALSFSPLALVCDKITIDDEEVINKSYPGFWNDLGDAGFELD